ncbi:hypothetical protein CTAYLR_001544 [Chrysophaeum taylorii]|uniref:EngB-type G domain-containing protein n=1 Tax=Chrysophaeum taylorii TaxID=2483200 RepID=A0AAD7UEP3_9STRA|nr:hypothetical protein CTAYLR_001544 [Chrysophaeum taylorii]
MRFPEALLRRLAEVAVPVTEQGTVWISAKMPYDMFEDFQDRTRPAAARVFGGSVRAKYVSPSALGYELPTEGRPEIAFAGRSNVGKSTLLGTLLGDVQLCRRSKRPGCTTTINFFEPGGPAPSYLVDLPGFGFAERPDDQKENWSRAMFDYLAARDRSVLRHAVLLVDARRGLSANAKDLEALQGFSALKVSHHVVLTKTDLVRPPDLANALWDTFHHLAKFRKRSTCLPIVHLVSAKQGHGIQDLRDYIGSFIAEAADLRRKTRRRNNTMAL